MTTRRTVLLSLAIPLAALVPAWSASFLAQLDPDKDGTLDARELRGRMSKSEFAAANPDNDGTLDRAEYLAVVETRFRAANPDNDGTIDAREFATPAGKKLLKLLK